MFRPLAIIAGLQLLSPAHGAQGETLIGDTILGVELSEVAAEVAATTDSLAERLTSGRLGGQDLERQEVTPVGTYVRTCDCLPDKSVVRHQRHVAMKLQATTAGLPGLRPA